MHVGQADKLFTDTSTPLSSSALSKGPHSQGSNNAGCEPP